MAYVTNQFTNSVSIKIASKEEIGMNYWWRYYIPVCLAFVIGILLVNSAM